MWYDWQCEACGRKRTVQRSVADRNTPEFCEHHTRTESGERVTIYPMKRVVSRFLFTANLEKDRPENNLARIMAGPSARDQAEWMKQDQATYEAKTEGTDYTPEKYVSMDDIDIQGAWTAANAGPDQLQRWRDDNIKQDDFSSSTTASE